METFVRVTAPNGWLDFIFKLFVALLICGGLNHFRDLLQSGAEGHDPFSKNFFDAAFTALPMAGTALFLIGHLSSLQKQLYHQMTRDILTGLHNRRWFMCDTSDYIDPNQALLIVDVDHFKKINDSYGHDVGDRCLKEVAQHLLDSIREGDCCARIGGEEFAIVLREGDLKDVYDIAAKISAGFPFAVENGPVHQITISVGITFDEVQRSRAEAMLQADKAVYRAKALGRACYATMTGADDDTSFMPHATTA